MQPIIDFLYLHAYDFYVQLTSYLVIAAGWIMVNLTLFFLEFFWDVGKAVLENLSISTYLQQFLNEIDNDIVAFMTYIRGFDALLVVLNARITRYLLSLLGM